MANKYNVHTQFYTNKKVVPGPEGILTGKNHNIQRGGGYGFNAKGTPGFGVMPIKSYSNCGTGKQPAVTHATGAIGTQHAGSPPPQRGGGKGACGCGGTPYYSFTAAGTSALARAGVNNYAPITPECHPMCGGRRRTRRRKGGRRKRRKKRKSRRRRKKRKSRRAPPSPPHSSPRPSVVGTLNGRLMSQARRDMLPLMEGIGKQPIHLLMLATMPVEPAIALITTTITPVKVHRHPFLMLM